MQTAVGSIVSCREREWVVMPSSDPDIILLRPLTGSEQEVVGIHRQLATFGIDHIDSASFPLPNPDDSTDLISSELLINSARLTLRDGAAPIRSLGRISVRPRPYQYVPLLMALRLNPIRMLIADDVGIGKTIEGLLIVRELLDRGEIQRLCVLCPPYLCEQWDQELREKFNIEPKVIKSGTVSALEKQLPAGDQSIFGYFPYIVVSIDYAKSDSHRDNFLHHCPEFIIVDEAHGAAFPSQKSTSQQQRHNLLKDLSKNTGRHIVLLTATPHSGIETSFTSLLSILNPQFSNYDLYGITDSQRNTLAKHFIQRRRADVEKWLGEETSFPERISEEIPYKLSDKYYELFKNVYEFSKELVETSETLTGWKRRVRHWAALAILRCVMSSPASATQTLKKQQLGMLAEEDPTDNSYFPYVYDPTDELQTDVQPSHIVEETEKDLPSYSQRKIREFCRIAESIQGTEEDAKLYRCAEVLKTLLKEGYHPVVWCRYIATSDYLAEHLKPLLKSDFPDISITSVTGTLSDDERKTHIEDISQTDKRVLIATDCLSEGINLQEYFTAAVHYDLPWNPNRLEQREGRVDRFGQQAKKVKAILIYGSNNRVDGAVLEVLLRKAKTIRKELGISVPVPGSETVMEAIFNSLFHRDIEDIPTLFEEEEVKNFNYQLEQSKEREKISRSKFAQHSLKPEEVEKELKETDAVLGDPETVKHFVLNACQRYDVTVKENKDGTYTLTNINQLPLIARESFNGEKPMKVSFKSPAPANAIYLGRTHSLVASLARNIVEESLTKGKEAIAARAGVVRTTSVTHRTVLLTLRTRFIINQPEKAGFLAEDIYTCGYTGFPPDNIVWLSVQETRKHLQNTQPKTNIHADERKEVLTEVLNQWDALQSGLKTILQQRAEILEDSHKRIRASAHIAIRGMKITPYLPPDLLSVLVLVPVPKGVL